ncbi:MAG: BLUF domain-containing protein [Betaproteobacteria bacterium]|nr:BLUF domain-containing protein [Candidatus Fonsibacter lacus]
MLVRLLYVSRAAQHEAPEAIDGILSTSRAHNIDQGGIFLQAIEGGREAVNRLYSVIVKDPRHTDVVLLSYEEISERRFGGWTMGQVNLAKVNASIVLKYSERPVFDPYQVSGSVSQALLDELMATASIIGRA